MTSTAREDEDGRGRCPWGSAPADYRHYHDNEWGRPVGDDRAVLEKLCLEGFQSGLSWLTVLRKRDNFRRAFAGFDAEALSLFGPDDVEALMVDASIIRHRAKIEAAITNARATARLHAQGLSLAGLVWSYEHWEVQRGTPGAAGTPLAAGTQAGAGGPCPGSIEEVRSWSPASRALSGELKGLGFGFVGPTTVYSAMQALGVVNEHLRGCWVREEAERERAEFVRPQRAPLRPGKAANSGRGPGRRGPSGPRR